MSYQILSLADQPQLTDTAARWFHEKWQVPEEAYRESIQTCAGGKSPVPQWYLAVEDGQIIRGLGVIENDFHCRRDLSPNVCALYVEEDRRCRGVAGALLDRVCADMARRGVSTLYLVTDHTSFYERYGWEFLCMVQETEAPRQIRMYRRRT